MKLLGGEGLLRAGESSDSLPLGSLFLGMVKEFGLMDGIPSRIFEQLRGNRIGNSYRMPLRTISRRGRCVQPPILAATCLADERKGREKTAGNGIK